MEEREAEWARARDSASVRALVKSSCRRRRVDSSCSRAAIWGEKKEFQKKSEVGKDLMKTSRIGIDVHANVASFLLLGSNIRGRKKENIIPGTRQHNQREGNRDRELELKVHHSQKTGASPLLAFSPEKRWKTQCCLPLQTVIQGAQNISARMVQNAGEGKKTQMKSRNFQQHREMLVETCGLFPPQFAAVFWRTIRKKLCKQKSSCTR